MKKRYLLISSLLGVVLFGAGVLTAAAPAAVAAAPNLLIAADAKSDACAGIGLSGTDCNGDGGVQAQANSIVGTLVNLFSIIVGVAAVVMIIVAGVRFITSSGDPSKVSSAKNTLLYALVGLVLVGAAQMIVHYVLTNI